MTTCPTGKRAYLSEEIALEALIGAWVHYDRSRGDGPVAIYRCDDCGQYHLTSKGPMHETLKNIWRTVPSAACHKPKNGCKELRNDDIKTNNKHNTPTPTV